MAPTTFREAVETRDLDALEALMAPGVVFDSPAVHKPYEGRPTVMVLLRTVLEVFEDFRYVGEAADPGGHEHVLRFRAKIGPRELEGIDWVTTDADGKIIALTVMVRPLSGLTALRDAMGARLAAT